MTCVVGGRVWRAGAGRLVVCWFSAGRSLRRASNDVVTPRRRPSGLLCMPSLRHRLMFSSSIPIHIYPHSSCTPHTICYLCVHTLAFCCFCLSGTTPCSGSLNCMIYLSDQFSHLLLVGSDVSYIAIAHHAAHPTTITQHSQPIRP